MSNSRSWVQPRSERRGVIKHLTNAFWIAASIGVFVGVVTYAYDLGYRNPANVPALRVAAEEYRRAPATPGGATTPGIENTASSAFGAAADPAAEPRLAAAAERPTAEDVDAAQREIETASIISMVSEAVDGATEPERRRAVDLDLMTPRAGDGAVAEAEPPAIPPNVGVGSVFSETDPAAQLSETAPPRAETDAQENSGSGDDVPPQGGRDAIVVAPIAPLPEPNEASGSAAQTASDEAAAPVQAPEASAGEQVASVAASQQSVPSSPGANETQSLSPEELLGETLDPSERALLGAAPAPNRRPAEPLDPSGGVDLAFDASQQAPISAPPRAGAPRPGEDLGPVPGFEDAAPGATAGGFRPLPLPQPEAAQTTPGPQDAAEARPAPPPLTPPPLTLEPSPALPTAEPSPPQEPTQEPAQAPIAPGGRYVVQLAALNSATAVRSRWRQLQVRQPDLLSNRQLILGEVQVDDSTLYRLRVAVESRAEGDRLCIELQRRGLSCFVASR